MLKQRITNDKDRLRVLAEASELIRQKIDMHFTLSEELTRPLMTLAESFPKLLNRQLEMARNRAAISIERHAYFQTLGYSISPRSSSANSVDRGRRARRLDHRSRTGHGRKHRPARRLSEPHQSTAAGDAQRRLLPAGCGECRFRR